MVVVVARRGSLFELYKNLVCREAESQIVGGGKVGDEKFCQIYAHRLQIDVTDRGMRPASHPILVGTALMLQPSIVLIMEGEVLYQETLKKREEIKRSLTRSVYSTDIEVICGHSGIANNRARG